MAKYKVMVVDDDPAIRFGIGDFLEHKGFAIEEGASLAEAKEGVLRSHPDVLILDNRLPDGHAVDVLAELRGLDPDVCVIVLTGHASIELAVQAVKGGAEQFLTKPVELATLHTVVERAIENQRNRKKQNASTLARAHNGIDPFLGTSRAILRLRQEATLALQTESPVLIQGETGSGKGVMARWLHSNGGRSQEAFVDLNCAGLSREFLESELFGHARGAFTTAVNEKKGLLEVAHRGVVFLDEIGDTATSIQAKLLKVLEEKTFRRLGEVRDRQVDVQLIAATNRDLLAMAHEETFRSDLYYRISTIPIRVPPLRERQEDLPELAADLLRRLSSDLKRGPLGLAAEAVADLQRHSWPGNVRELRNVLERAALSVRDGRIRSRDLRFDSPAGRPLTSAAGGTPDPNLTLEELERQQIVQVLGEERGRVISAAERLGVPRSTLYMKIKSYRIDLRRFQR